MATNENNHILNIFHKGLYIIIGLECILLFAPESNSIFIHGIMNALYRLKLLHFPSVKWFQLIVLFLVVIGIKPKKKIDVDITKEIDIHILLDSILFVILFFIINNAILTKNHLFG